LSRFGDTAANTGTIAFLNSFDSTKDMILGKSMAASTGFYNTSFI